MTDVIRNINTNNQVTGSGSKPAAKTTEDTGAQKASSSAASSTNNVDQVNITDSAQKVDQIIANLSAEPVVNREKVDEIKTALAEGRYEVNSAVIADKLIEIDELLK